MSRPLRIEFPGALYHVTARGNERKPIVRDELDCENWLAGLTSVSARFGWRFYAWCLMRNHYHLLLETPRPNLARGMRELNGLYAQGFNRRHHRVGHLFQGRYKAILVEREPHLLEACRYVVLNPARLRRPTQLYERWAWSSYRACAGFAPAPFFLALDRLLEQFAPERERAQRAYRAFVRNGLGVATPWQGAEGALYLADKPYIRRRGSGVRASPESPRRQREPITVSLEELLRSEGDRAILRAYREGGYRLREIAAALDVHYSTVSRRLAAQEQAAARGDLLRCKT
ncbi:MAG: transposase [Actinomycetota bacterium]|nr:transposase [Actinomycetota bacterium]